MMNKQSFYDRSLINYSLPSFP